MGRCLMVYATDDKAVCKAIGSGDDKVRKMISGRFRQEIYSRNDQLGYSNERGADSVFTGIRHLIMGDERTLEGDLYFNAYEMIVQFYGRFLDNSQFCPFRGSWLEDVNKTLKNHGATLDLHDLAYGEALVPLPEHAIELGTGDWSREAVSANLSVLAAASGLPEEVRHILGWLREADGQRRLVGFCY